MIGETLVTLSGFDQNKCQQLLLRDSHSLEVRDIASSCNFCTIRVLTSFSTLLALESLETAQLPLLEASPSNRCRLLREFLGYERLKATAHSWIFFFNYKKYTSLCEGLPGVVTLLTNEIPLQFTAVDLQTRKYSSHDIFNNPKVGLLQWWEMLYSNSFSIKNAQIL